MKMVAAQWIAEDFGSDLRICICKNMPYIDYLVYLRW